MMNEDGSRSPDEPGSASDEDDERAEVNPGEPDHSASEDDESPTGAIDSGGRQQASHGDATNGDAVEKEDEVDPDADVAVADEVDPGSAVAVADDPTTEESVDRTPEPQSWTDEPDVAYELAPDCDAEDVETGRAYRATVNGVVPYGVFVDCSDRVSGLIHESDLADTYAVGDELFVELENRRDNGDLAFVPVDIDPERVVRVDPGDDAVDATDLEAHRGESVRLVGEVVQIKQTGGPTIFHVRDRTGIVPCAAFEAAGVRAYPSVQVGDVVRASGTVEHRDGTVQLETEAIVALDGEAASAVRDDLDAAVAERAAPPELDQLVDWPALEALRPALREVATLLRRAVLEGRPIRIRHHADGDGMCAAVPVAMALERYVARVHHDPEAARHMVRRLPSKAPFYELEDATRDLTHALEDRSRHGQRLPLLCMIDNGSTAEDVPAYETLAQYDIPIVAIDHHHPDPEAVGDLLAAHVNPYLEGEDYRITAGMLCVELARLIDPDSGPELRHVPAVAGLSDRSKADAMDDYLELAGTAGFDLEALQDVSEALDYLAYLLRYRPGDPLIRDVLRVDGAEPERHAALVRTLADRSRAAVATQLADVRPHVEHEHLESGVELYRVDLEAHAHRFQYPAPGKTTGELHDELIADGDGPAITIGYGPDFAVLRSDGVRLDIPEMVAELRAEVPGAGVSGGGHLVVGSIKFVPGTREAVIDALVRKMAAAPRDERLSSATPLGERS